MAERIHGGIDELALRARAIDPQSVVDFSVNLNPYGPCEPVLDAARRARLDRYPDAQARAARSAWARTLKRTPEELAVGHGAADLFWAIARAALRKDDKVVIAEPTFSEFRIAAATITSNVERVYGREEEGFPFDLHWLAKCARAARALYLCSPNNPTGELVPSVWLRELAARIPDTLLVLDQSFMGFSDQDDRSERWPENVLCVRSLTKEFACPGLRIGLCMGSAAWIERIEAMRPTWATSNPALAALEQSAHETAFVVASWQRIRADRDATRLLLRARGRHPISTDTSFQLVPIAEGAASFCQQLLAHGVLLRDCSSFGLPRHVRVAALPEAARNRLVAALDAIAHE